MRESTERFLPRAVLTTVLVVGAVLRLAVAQHHRAVDFDEGRYLDNAANILEGRGLASSYTSHFFRSPSEAPPVHPEDISSPVYPWLLAGTFAVTGVELRPAQWWSLVPGCVMIWLTFLLGRSLFGESAGLLAAALVALNPDMITLSAWAMTESLYGALLLVLLMAICGRAGPATSLARWVALGLACGTLYLVRANALGVAAAVGLVALMPERGEATGGVVVLSRRLARAGVFALGFMVCVSPWLARNERLFGSPTHTAMKNVAWSESGYDLFRRDRPAPSLASFREEHGDGALARNLARRAGRAAGYLVWGDTAGYNLLCALYPLALVSTWGAARTRAGHLCTILSALLLLGVPVWTGALSRYLLPTRPWIYVTVIGAMTQLPELIARWRVGGFRALGDNGAPPRERTDRRFVLAAATLAALVVVSSGSRLREHMSRDETERDRVAREAARWIARETPEGSVLMEGAYVHQYAFLFDRPVVWVPAGGLDELTRAARDYGARYLIVSAELLRFRPDIRRHFELADGAVRATDLPDGFEEVFAGSGRRVVIWRLPAVPAT